eukprot:c9723_g1_i1.p1 GENE.c9723_g1_i1~~c9723_g1_i1.p1  ORF type:complete len:467 (-),score=84.32 c9723_g1_i1:1697-3097(-)
MGNFSSSLEKDLPSTEKFFGFENYDNTCYCNSVLQALYFCTPFRKHVLSYQSHHRSRILGTHDESKRVEDTLLQRLAELFVTIATHKKQTGVIGPKKFVTKLRKENELFQGDEHQDAHEFLNYLLNHIVSVLQKEAAPSPNTPLSEISKIRTWVHELFEGTLTNETKCLCCETVTNVVEPFLDLSVDVESNSSLTACLSKFSSTETLSGAEKFFCDKCCGLQEAQKRMLVKKLPQILTVHLKRFKYFENVQQYRKLSSRVVFPFELRVCNTSDDCEESDRLYHLFAVVIHSGSGLNHGHYVCVVKSHQKWLLFDDERVDTVDPLELQSYCFGSTSKSTDVAYLLFYSTASDMPTESESEPETPQQDASVTSRRQPKPSNSIAPPLPTSNHSTSNGRQHHSSQGSANSNDNPPPGLTSPTASDDDSATQDSSVSLEKPDKRDGVLAKMRMKKKEEGPPATASKPQKS